jgi:hypothetical protein
MRREVVELIEAARALKVQRVPRPDNPRNIRIGGDRKEFPDRLHRMAVALEAVDRAGAQALDGMGRDPSMDAARLRMALDGVFRWMRSVGMDIAEPHAVVANALGAQAKAGKAFKPTPKSMTKAIGKKGNGGLKPLLRLEPGPGEAIAYHAIRERAAILAEQARMAGGPAPEVPPRARAGRSR